MAGREGWSFESGRHVEKDTIPDARSVSRRQTQEAEGTGRVRALVSRVVWDRLRWFQEF